MEDIKEYLDNETVKNTKEVFGDKIETVSIHGKEHPTYSAVLNQAHEVGIDYIKTKLIQAPLSENNYMAIVIATVALKGKGVFSGIGDATPKNVNSMIAPHIVRMAETRAKGRALRDALNISEALKEELGGDEHQDLYNRSSEATEDLGNCAKCGAPNRMSQQGKPYCSKLCWKNG